MFDADPDRTLEVLDEDECHRLLGTAVIGRLAFTEGALPTIQPVHFVVAGDRIVIPTRAGSKAAVASRGAVVAFEADEIDLVGRVGWNVTVIGPSRVVLDPVEIRSLDALAARGWVPGEDPCYITVQMALLRGRRVTAGRSVGAEPSALLAGTAD